MIQSHHTLVRCWAKKNATQMEVAFLQWADSKWFIQH